MVASFERTVWCFVHGKQTTTSCVVECPQCAKDRIPFQWSPEWDEPMDPEND